MWNHPMRKLADDALLSCSKATKVSLTQEQSPGVYRAHCQKQIGTERGGWSISPVYESLGTWEVKFDLETKILLEARRIGDFILKDFL
jgi:hypothetical protein